MVSGHQVERTKMLEIYPKSSNKIALPHHYSSSQLSLFWHQAVVDKTQRIINSKKNYDRTKNIKFIELIFILLEVQYSYIHLDVMSFPDLVGFIILLCLRSSNKTNFHHLI